MEASNFTNNIPRNKIQIQDFLVDVLGGLVPGTLLVGGLAFLVLPIVVAINNLLSPTQPYGMHEALKTVASIKTPDSGTFWLGLIGALVSVAYVIGHLVYRRDPKEPDRRSFAKLSKDKDPKVFKTEFACTTQDDCEFPFPYIGSYLRERKLGHLLPFVLWDEEEHPESQNARSKVYINILKIRLRFHFPEKIAPIIRNEAHVRLASSGWYAARYLELVAIVSTSFVVLAMVVNILAKLRPTIECVSLHTMLILPPIFVLVLSLFVRNQIENFIHYQRIREVVYVLETAYTAFRSCEGLLNPPYELSIAKDREESKRGIFSRKS